MKPTPLTDEELWTLWNAQGTDEMNRQEAMMFARVIEAAVNAKWEALQAKPVELDLSKYVIVTNAEFFPRRLSNAELVEKTGSKQMKCIYCNQPADFTHTCPQSRGDDIEGHPV